jgi:hypothetical protein
LSTFIAIGLDGVMGGMLLQADRTAAAVMPAVSSARVFIVGLLKWMDAARSGRRPHLLRKSPDGGCTAGKAASKKAGLQIEAPALSGSGSVAYFDAFTM